MRRLTDYVLTERGLDWYNKNSDTWGDRLSGVAQEAFSTAASIYEGSRLDTKDYKEEVDFLLMKGYIEEDPRELEHLLRVIPPLGNLKRNMRTYTKVAQGLPVRLEDLELLRMDLIHILSKWEHEGFDEDLSIPKRLRDLRGAKTTSDKIIAIDSAMQVFHLVGGRGVIDYPIGPGIEPESYLAYTEESRTLHQTILKILDKLFEG